jgi:hypothetical protein
MSTHLGWHTRMSHSATMGHYKRQEMKLNISVSIDETTDKEGKSVDDVGI